MRIPLLGLVFLLACGGSSHSTSDAGPGDGASGDGSSGGTGTMCGGLVPRQCAATEYCDYPDNDCGIGDQIGICRTRPQVCPLSATGAPALVAMPTCACNGMVYGGECDAYRAGADLDAQGGCDLPAGEFACGYLQCLIGKQYCRRQPHTTGPETFACLALPAACSGTPGCACLASEPCGTSCTGSSGAGMTLACAPAP
jgi:hypothetical protein